MKDDSSTCDQDDAGRNVPGVVHNGFISSLGPNLAQITLVGAGGCGSCSARGGCAAAQKTRVIEVPRDMSMKMGQEVELTLEGRRDLFAVAMLLIIPAVLMLIAFFLASMAGADDMVAALCALAGAGLWYGVVRLFRATLEKKTSFIIRILNQTDADRKEVHE